MKVQDAKSIVELIRNSSIGELSLLSIMILPIYLGSWTLLLKQMNAKLWDFEIVILAILVAIYVLTIIIAKYSQTEEQKIEHASFVIRSYIISRKWTRMSYDRIKETIDNDYNEEMILSIIRKFPNDFRKGTIIGGKKALVLLGEESDN